MAREREYIHAIIFSLDNMPCRYMIAYAPELNPDTPWMVIEPSSSNRVSPWYKTISGTQRFLRTRVLKNPKLSDVEMKVYYKQKHMIFDLCGVDEEHKW